MGCHTFVVWTTCLQKHAKQNLPQPVKCFTSSVFGHGTGTKYKPSKSNIMQSTITKFGELITGEIRKNGSNFIVDKYVDGQYRTSYPADSYGRAKMILMRQLA